jgi:hypothetical protein
VVQKSVFVTGQGDTALYWLAQSAEATKFDTKTDSTYFICGKMSVLYSTMLHYFLCFMHHKVARENFIY